MSEKCEMAEMVSDKRVKCERDSAIKISGHLMCTRCLLSSSSFPNKEEA